MRSDFLASPARRLERATGHTELTRNVQTEIKYNAEGDLLFSCSKDHVINAWYSHNGERLGTYDGHNGTVWTVDVDCTSSCLRLCG